MSQTSRVGVDMLQHMFPQFVYKLLCLLCCLLRRILRLVTTLLHWAGICYYDLYQYGSKCTSMSCLVADCAGCALTLHWMCSIHFIWSAIYFNISIWQVVEFYLVLSAHVADGAAACVSGVWPGGCSAEIDNTNIRHQIWACWGGQQRYFMGFPYSLWAMIFQRKYIISINLT